MINFLLLDLLECRRHEQSLNQKISDVAMEREQLVCILKPMRMPFCILYAYRKMQKKKNNNNNRFLKNLCAKRIQETFKFKKR